MPLFHNCIKYPNDEDEKRQFKTVRVLSSQYTHSLSSFTGGYAMLKKQPLHSNTSDQPDKGGVSVKHDSYARYLNKRKAISMLNTNNGPVVEQNNVVNNKRNKNGIGILSEICKCNV
jgi:hypothetical protein